MVTESLAHNSYTSSNNSSSSSSSSSSSHGGVNTHGHLVALKRRVSAESVPVCRSARNGEQINGDVLVILEAMAGHFPPTPSHIPVRLEGDTSHHLTTQGPSSYSTAMSKAMSFGLGTLRRGLNGITSKK